ncbi:MAG TPA: aspartyl-phosphate phosphatase Spo0E family protein [Firmicutes bacterium]|nr:aspartyl-phosphate phosphatase Spo0E family protein [Bacillota bacterium]
MLKRVQIRVLKRRIANARRRMQSLWNVKGSTDAEVLRASVELDLLINKYQRFYKKEERTRRFKPPT